MTESRAISNAHASHLLLSFNIRSRLFCRLSFTFQGPILVRDSLLCDSPSRVASINVTNCPDRSNPKMSANSLLSEHRHQLDAKLRALVVLSLVLLVSLESHVMLPIQVIDLLGSLSSDSNWSMKALSISTVSMSNLTTKRSRPYRNSSSPLLADSTCYSCP